MQRQKQPWHLVSVAIEGAFDINLMFRHAETYNPFPSFNYTGSMRPAYPLSSKRTIPEGIAKPEWADTSQGPPIFS